MRLCGGTLLQDGAAGAQSLARVVQAALDPLHGGAARWSLRVARRQGPPLLLTVTPYRPPPAVAWLPPCAIIMARDPAAQRLSPVVLSQLFSLTPAEAGVAQELARGQDLDAIAATFAISAHTVKPTAAPVPQDGNAAPGRAGGGAARFSGRHGARHQPFG